MPPSLVATGDCNTIYVGLKIFGVAHTKVDLQCNTGMSRYIYVANGRLTVLSFGFYRCVGEGGPAHAKRFTYSVRVHTTTDGWTDDCVGEPMPSVKKAKDSAAVLLLAYLKRL